MAPVASPVFHTGNKTGKVVRPCVSQTNEIVKSASPMIIRKIKADGSLESRSLHPPLKIVAVKSCIFGTISASNHGLSASQRRLRGLGWGIGKKSGR